VSFFVSRSASEPLWADGPHVVEVEIQNLSKDSARPNHDLTLHLSYLGFAWIDALNETRFTSLNPPQASSTRQQRWEQETAKSMVLVSYKYPNSLPGYATIAFRHLIHLTRILRQAFIRDAAISRML
jgi:hypothetical protein